VVRILPSIFIAALLITAKNAHQAWADGAEEDAQLNAAVAVENDKGEFQPLERLVLRTAHGRAFREGDRLTLFLDGGNQMILRGHECSPWQVIRENCASYYLVADLPSRHAFVVGTKHSRDRVRLIDDRTGRQTVLPAIPQFGPDNSEFVTFDNDIGYGKPGIAIWRWRDGSAQIAWRHGIELDPVFHATALVRWAEPDAIYLDLWCFAGPHWPASAKRGPDGWRLESKWPALSGGVCGNPDLK
jgi:hypothetical protein